VERKLRVLSDWILELFFPRDIVQTVEFNDRRSLHQSGQEMAFAEKGGED
jgi:hypothetical protein